MHLVSATKGLEIGTLMRVSEVIREVIEPHFRRASPSCRDRRLRAKWPAATPPRWSSHPTDRELAEAIQSAFSGPTFRLYTSPDPVGVEVGGSVKNVVAIGAGVCHGLGFGSNALAALITRGLAEISRLALAMGGHPKTLAGLAGLGGSGINLYWRIKP